MTHIVYFFACNFWTARDFENSFGNFFQICFPYNNVWNLTKINDVMVSWRHDHDVKISIMWPNYMHFIQTNLSFTLNAIFSRLLIELQQTPWIEGFWFNSTTWHCDVTTTKSFQRLYRHCEGLSQEINIPFSYLPCLCRPPPPQLNIFTIP